MLRPLEGIRVLELATVLAGPAVGSFLAELGADVLKVEPPQGDVTRSWKAPGESQSAEHSAYYASVNHHKTVVTKDLNNPIDRQWVLNEIKSCRIVLTNFRTHQARKLGVDFASLTSCRTDLLYAEITGFSSAPARPAYDVVLQAETGWMDLNGPAKQGGIKMPVALVDVLAAHQLKEAILTTLLGAKPHTAYHIQVNLEQSSISALANQATNWLMNQQVPQPPGNAHPNIAPYGEVLTFQDGLRLVLAVGTDKQFTTLCQVLHVDHVIRDARFGSNPQRVIHRTALLEELQQAAAQQNGATTYTQLVAQGVPVGKINNLEAVFNTPSAKQLLVEDSIGIRVKQSAFTITPTP